MKDNKRTTEELNKAFRLEIKDFEQSFNEACFYSPRDEMREKKIANLALCLRKLIIDTKEMVSLCSQLGISDQLLFCPICTFSKSDFAGNIVPVYPLIETAVQDGSFFCRAVFHKEKTNLRFGLQAWLNEVVIDPKGEQIFKPTRYSVIRTIADKEGGAHYDVSHDETYLSIKNNYAYEIVQADGTTINLSNNCFFETMLSIAFEFIQSINEYFYIHSLINKRVLPSSLYLVVSN